MTLVELRVPPEGFLKSFTPQPVFLMTQADLVLLGQVQAIKGNAVDLVPETILKGRFWLDTLRVWMKTQDYCRPPAEYFALGSRWVMALSQIQERPEDSFNPSTPNQSFGRLLDYQLSSCGGYFLQVSGNTVRGNLVPGTTRWDQQPDMNPVLLDLLRSYLAGDASVESLKRAAEEDPEVRELMLNTRSFLRGQEGLLPEQEPAQDDAP